MTATLPTGVQQVFDRFITTEFTTVDRRGQPITWPLTPYYRPGDPCIDVTTGLGYPKKANDARANPKVAMLFSDPTGSGLESASQVLVQGTADVDDRDLDANRERYKREIVEKLPATQSEMPPKVFERFIGWYLTRIYIHVRPERIYVWSDGAPAREPQLFDAHMEEVRSGHPEEPEVAHPEIAGGATAWDDRMDELGAGYPEAVVSLVAPDGFPFSVRLPVGVDRSAQRVRLGGAPVGVPWQPGLACVTAHDHAEDFKWQRNFQVRGDLVEEDGAWAIIPRKLVGGFELPPGGVVSRARLNMKKMRRFRKTAKRELAARGR
ncbi:MAG: pyridoxamine 5'-phosphate oxidase family protein [Thermoleophilaceae bacterium]|nr:pyridoxamine 5'-phosphate oxidase family protein [Thermoleophilaceae bacterium]